MQTRPGWRCSRSTSGAKSPLSFVTSTYPSATARRTRAQSCRARNPSHVTCIDSGYPRSRAIAAKCGAQTFVDQELHRAGGSALKAASPKRTGLRERQKGAFRGRPRRG